jgi:pilus assembly protein CpaE
MTDTPPAAAAKPPAPARTALPPRLAIHAFCEDQATAELLRAASADRRLARAYSTVQMGGVHLACGFYEKAPTPNLILVESLLGGAEMLADLERLALVCEPETKVLVIGHINDVLLYRELMRRGVSDYLVPPFSPEEVAEAVIRVFADEPAPPPGRVMAFIGAKGGVGSSTISHNVGWTLAESLVNVSIIADLDLAFGTASLNFNQDPAQGTAQALSIADRLDEAMADKLLSKCSDRLSLLSAAADLADDAQVTPEAAARLVEVLGRSAPNVVLDLPRHWSPWLRPLLTRADEVVITAEPDLANLRNAKNLFDALADHRPKDRPALLVLNKVNVPRRPEISPRDFAGAVGLDPAAVIDFDPALFGAAANNGLMIGEASRKAKPAEQFRALASMLVRGSVTPPQEQGFLAPILGRLTRKRSASGGTV